MAKARRPGRTNEGMDPMKFRTTTWALLALTLILTVSMVTDDALAQGRRGGGTTTSSSSTWQKPPIELSATYGTMWGGNIQMLNGKLRTATGPSVGIALDIPLHPFAALELSYTRQEGAMDWDGNGSQVEKLSDMSVNYWQIGAIKGMLDGAVRPFFTTSLGATYYSPTESQVTIDGTTYQISTSTKFSFSLGAGVKAYFGEAQRFGLRGSFKTFSTLYNTGGGVWFGGGGASLGVTGSAIWQWEAAIGLTVKLGG